MAGIPYTRMHFDISFKSTFYIIYGQMLVKVTGKDRKMQKNVFYQTSIRDTMINTPVEDGVKFIGRSIAHGTTDLKLQKIY